MITDWIKFIEKWGGPYIQGTLITLKISFLGVFIGLFLGLFVALMRMSKKKFPRIISGAYVELIRGTPLIVQVMIAYYGFISIIPDQYGWLKNPFALSLAAICINSSAYVSEVIRSGLQSVDKGQMEAARSLGLNQRQAMRHVIIPQAIKIVLPALGNEFVTLIKESAIVAFVGIPDIMYAAKVASGASYRVFKSYILAMVIYFVLVFTLSKLLQAYERRLKASDSR